MTIRGTPATWVVLGDTFAREFKRDQRFAAAARARRLDLGFTDAQAELIQIDLIEFLGIADERVVTIAANRFDYFAHSRIDVRRYFALFGKKDLECLLETRVRGGQAL